MCELQWDESHFGSESLGHYPEITLSRGYVEHSFCALQLFARAMYLCHIV